MRREEDVYTLTQHKISSWCTWYNENACFISKILNLICIKLSLISLCCRNNILYRAKQIASLPLLAIRLLHVGPEEYEYMEKLVSNTDLYTTQMVNR